MPESSFKPDISSLTAFLSSTGGIHAARLTLIERAGEKRGKRKLVQSKHRHANSLKSVSVDGKV